MQIIKTIVLCAAGTVNAMKLMKWMKGEGLQNLGVFMVKIKAITNYLSIDQMIYV